MSLNTKRFFSLISGIVLATSMTLGCDDEEPSDAGGENAGGENAGGENAGGENAGGENAGGDHGLSDSCKPLTKEEIPNWSMKDGSKKDIVDYLVSICRLNTYFQTQEFLNKPAEEQGIGSHCFCYGQYCEMVGYERPESQETPDTLPDGTKNENVYGTLFGCDGVKDYQGAQQSCFRSAAVEGIEPKIYFPNGTCALAMSKCTPLTDNADGSICSFAKFGDYSQIDDFTTCPDMKEVLLDFVMNIEVKGVNAKAKLDLRACFKGCKTDADCSAVGIYDTIVNEESQTKCMMVGNDAGQTAGVCFDARTIQGVEEDMKLVHPGGWIVE